MRTAAPLDRRAVLLAVAGAGVLAAISGLVLHGASLNYDTQYAMGWGAALAEGHAPEIELDGAPTSHPLVTLVAAAGHLVSADAVPDLLRVLAHLSLGALLVLLVLAGRELGGLPVGLAAAALVAISPAVLMNTALAFPDVLTAALVVAALLLELRRPRRGTAPLVLLAVAGLVRPEAWGLAIAYALWCALEADGRRRLELAGLALIGPALWMLSDLAWGGDLLLSLHRTREGAEVALRPTGLGQGPTQLQENLRSALRIPGIAAAGAGGVVLLVALVAPRRLPGALRTGDRRWAVVLGLAVLLVLGFFTLALGRLSLLERYVIPLISVLALCAGHALAGWWRAPRGPLRLAWAGAAVLLAAGIVSVVPSQAQRVEDELRGGRERQDVVEQLDALAASPALRRCAPDAVATYRLVPFLAHALDRRPGTLPILEDPRRLPRGAAWVAAAGPLGVREFGPVQGRPPAVPADLRREGGTGEIAVYARDC